MPPPRTANARAHLRALPPPPDATPAAPKSALDDSVLLAGVRRRDPTIASAFYERVRPIVDRTVTRLLGGHDTDYEDVAQLSLSEIVQTIERFRGECPLDAWLSIISARVVYRYLRRRKVERRLFSLAPLEEVVVPSRSGVSQHTRDAIERVRAHLQQMDERRAWTFVLHDVYGYDLKEIGTIMGVGLAAAQSRLVRGRREIHERVRRDSELQHFFEDFSEGEP